jgi:hypothetical protein
MMPASHFELVTNANYIIDTGNHLFQISGEGGL